MFAANVNIEIRSHLMRERYKGLGMARESVSIIFYILLKKVNFRRERDLCPNKRSILLNSPHQQYLKCGILIFVRTL